MHERRPAGEAGLVLFDNVAVFSAKIQWERQRIMEKVKEIPFRQDAVGTRNLAFFREKDTK